jgi:hypothetical protein
MRAGDWLGRVAALATADAARTPKRSSSSLKRTPEVDEASAFDLNLDPRDRSAVMRAGL